MDNLLLIYVICCFLVIYLYLYRQKKRWLATLLIAIFFPVLGIILIYLMNKKGQTQSEKAPITYPINKAGQKALGRGEAMLFSGLGNALSVIPIEDALYLNENKLKRSMLLDLLKEESIQNMTALKIALENDDTETSHYAASAIMEIKRKLLNSMQSLERQVEERPDDLAVLSAYGDILKKYVQSGFLDDRTLLKNLYKYANILEKMIELNPNEENFFIEKITCELSLREYEKARMYCDLFLKLHPLCEDAYFLDMQIHFKLRDQEAFQCSIEQLRYSSVRLSPAGLSKLRFWLRGDSCEEGEI